MNPYQSLPPEAFWRPSIADRSMFEVDSLWKPKFKINRPNAVVAYGSCFAQHLGRALEANNFTFLRTEDAPIGMSEETLKRFNYGIFSSRTGNIYTTSLLEQWVDWALEIKSPPQEVWQKGGRFYDPFRPNVEPDGFASEADVLQSRDVTIKAFRKSIMDAKVFVFTLGLTESWRNSEFGYEYPMCPGTVAGEFDADTHKFVNMKYGDVMKSLRGAVEKIREANLKLKFLLTVSPVPLTASNSGKHVLLSTMYSKSTLRAVAGDFADESRWVDYFPSYEIINSPVFRGAFFKPNQRDVTQHGVNFVMSHLFAGLDPENAGVTPTAAANTARRRRAQKASDVICEEELLDAFS